MSSTVKTFKQMILANEVKRADAMKVRLDDIHEEVGFNLREEGEDLAASIEALAQHIHGGGVIPALEVRPRPDGGVWVVDGHRRRRALLLARERGAPIEWVNIVAFTGNDADRVARIITSAEGRALKPIEVARGYLRLTAFGLSPVEIAQRVGKTRQHVEQLLILAQAPTAVQRAVSAGEVSASVATKVTRKHGDGASEVIAEAVEKAKAAGKKRATPVAFEGPTLLALVRDLVASCPADARDGETVVVDGAVFRELVTRAFGGA